MADTSSEPPLITLVGPTASGKTALGIALAERLNGEVISADSVQIYRYFDIGSGKPGPEDLGRVPHHLIDRLDPLEAIDAGGFRMAAEEALTSIRARGKRPILVGGTFLWIRMLLFGMAAAPGKDPAIRESHRALVEREGRAALHALLRDRDPESFARLAANDFIRVSRALEVFQLTGKPLSTLQREHGFAEARHPALLFGVAHDDAALTARITERVERMFRAGFREEVEGLLARGYERARAMGSVGYREMKEALLAGADDESELKRQIVRKTRIFARRQRTWLRQQPVFWIDTDAPEAQLDRILAQLARAHS